MALHIAPFAHGHSETGLEGALGVREVGESAGLHQFPYRCLGADKPTLEFGIPRAQNRLVGRAAVHLAEAHVQKTTGTARYAEQHVFDPYPSLVVPADERHRLVREMLRRRADARRLALDDLEFSRLARLRRLRPPPGAEQPQQSLSGDFTLLHMVGRDARERRKT